MKKVCLFSVLLVACALSAQVTTVPAFITKGYTGQILVNYNPAEGSGGMKDATQCYAHTGVTIGSSTWQHSSSWRGGEEKYKMNKVGDLWQLVIPNMYEFYGCKETDDITQLCFVFNDGKGGSLEGKTASGEDFFVDLVEPGLHAKLQSPSESRLMSEGETLNIVGVTSEEAELTLAINNEVVKTATAMEISFEYELKTQGDYEILFTATTADDTKADTVVITVMSTTVEVARPDGVVNGIYYDDADQTKVTLCTYAASKTEPAKAVFVVGDFNNWQISSKYQLKRDGNYFWITLDNLVPQKEYAYQYVVVRADDVVKRISDLYAEKVLSSDDSYEPRQQDPTLMKYPKQGDGYVAVLQTGRTQYPWSEATLNFQRPDKNNLVIYELWVYDYTPKRSFTGVYEKLDYLQNLGVNAIEFMPLCEFDGNYSWGYNPNHYFALDKAYGTREQFKALVDECHKRGMAVIVDMVFNHSNGNNPMVKLYPYGNDLKYNPWCNVNPPEGESYGEDWNHDFEPTRDMFTRCLQYWLTEYKIDGFRMDLSHGFCGTTCSNLLNNINHYYTEGVQKASEGAYFILEHWGATMSSDRPKLIKNGMLCWQNTNNAYSQLAMGWLQDGDGLADANNDGYVSYCESHDEERNYFKAMKYGVDAIKNDEEARLSRVPLTIAFNVLLNGPHMIWQFNELGYDYSINSTLNGKNDDTNSGNRTSKKAQPETLGWFKAGIRMNQYQKVGQLIRLRTELAPEVFEGNPNIVSISSGKTVRFIDWGEGKDRIYVVGNFSATDVETAFLPEGSWYDYFAQTRQTTAVLRLTPGELKIYTGKKYDLPYIPAAYDGVTPIYEQRQEAFAVVYPTLTDGIVNITEEPTAILYDLSGKLLMKEDKATTINLSGYQNGMYVLHLLKNGQQQIVKLIKK